MSRQARGKLTLYGPVTYQIQVPGQLDEQWTEWNGTMTVTVVTDADGGTVTTLTGTIDQAGLQGLLRRLYALGLPLLSVHCVDCEQEENDEAL